MPQSPPPLGARMGRRAWQGSEACWRLLCPELRSSMLPVRGHWHPLVPEIGPVVSGLGSWPCAQLGVENSEHFALRNCLGQKIQPNYRACKRCTAGLCLPLSHNNSGNTYHVVSACSESGVYLRALHSFCQLIHRAKLGAGCGDPILKVQKLRSKCK